MLLEFIKYRLGLQGLIFGSINKKIPWLYRMSISFICYLICKFLLKKRKEKYLFVRKAFHVVYGKQKGPQDKKNDHLLPLFLYTVALQWNLHNRNFNIFKFMLIIGYVCYLHAFIFSPLCIARINTFVY